MENINLGDMVVKRMPSGIILWGEVVQTFDGNGGGEGFEHLSFKVYKEPCVLAADATNHLRLFRIKDVTKAEC